MKEFPAGIVMKIPAGITLREEEEIKLKLFQQTAKSYSNGNEHVDFQKWFLSKAESFTKVDEEKSIKLAITYRLKIKQCYHNCWEAINHDHSDNLTYYEGFVRSGGFELDHAWLVDKNGSVIDPTLAITGEKLKKQLKKYVTKVHKNDGERKRFGTEYFGIAYTIKQVNKFALKTKQSGCFLHHLFKEEKN